MTDSSRIPRVPLFFSHVTLSTSHAFNFAIDHRHLHYLRVFHVWLLPFLFNYM